MSQDILSDNLNEIMNAKRAGKNEVVITKFQKLFLEVLEIMKKEKAIEYKVDEKNKEIKINIEKLNKTRAIKPRFKAGVEKMEKYIRRYLPARDFGFIIITTNKGLMTHKEALEKNVGGFLVSYFY